MTQVRVFQPIASNSPRIRNFHPDPSGREYPPGWGRRKDHCLDSDADNRGFARLLGILGLFPGKLSRSEVRRRMHPLPLYLDMLINNQLFDEPTVN